MIRKKGFSLLEVLIASAITIFLLFTAFYAIGNLLSGSILAEKKVELADELDNRINHFFVTKVFDDSPSGEMTFANLGSNANIITFIGTNSIYNISITKRIFDQADSNENTEENNSGKVTICHKPGTGSQKTLTIPTPALNAHFGHGDYMGACSGS
ncbi:prepilin-type N-terminal cleavage/methylation domain-containing protein [Allofrancisella guangzhouensis]|uniref:PulJ/GspJ family protein n=1 Tax=Allofrancisella guangzhouensis TaxID=594679 RepID=UPI00068A1432|nr:prepilin-type N-terminal cleavage/methylation domain-containing protein [Allofrancisella guangzhouensis]MBK2044757.1 prepilin-type N-terminal cleavage/methylation domain-containing protein [Allofrancisella guangzhouensis]MBK2045871.1 prepilin-type N-terminal cleavage/methylation domain-containing protein [Allofrancisella guangzhouensis]